MKHLIIVSAPMFVSGIVMIVLLLDLLQHPSRALRALVVFMGVATLLYMAHCVYFLHETPLIPFTDTIYSTANPMVFPLYYIYIKCLTDYQVRKKDITLLTIPSIVCGLAVGIIYLMMNEQQLASFIDGYLYKRALTGASGVVGAQIAAHQAVKILFGLEIIPILWLGLQRIRNFDKLLVQNYSSADDMKLTWVKVVLLVFVSACLISFTINIIGRHRFADNLDLLAIHSVFFSLLIFTIGYVGMKQKGIEELDELLEVQEETSKTVALNQVNPRGGALSGMTSVGEIDVADDTKITSLRQRIEALMSEKKLYLQPQLKLNDLVRALSSNRNYVYQVINVDMGMSFSEYVNRLRIEHAKQLMKFNPTLSFADIAIKSGFSSSVSFYRNFRLYVGCSPQEYRSGKTL